jgi:uncharacterized protein DUF6458
MRIGVSLFLIALGAILTFAVNVQNSHGFNVNNAGLILMIIGAAGLIITGIWMTSRRRTDILTHGVPTYGAAPGAPVGPVYGQPVTPVAPVSPVYGQPVVQAPGTVYGPGVRRQTVVEPNDPALGPF